MRTLLVAAGIHPLAPPDEPGSPDNAVRAILLDGRRIAWVGPAEPEHAPAADRTIDLGGAWITPAFVDAHVHATATGLAATGVDLSGAASAAEALDRVRRHAAASDTAIVQGFRWDDLGWPEGRPMTAAEVAEAAPGKTVLLIRVDAHSCVVDPGTLARLPLPELDGVDRDERGSPTGWLAEQACEAARSLISGGLPSSQVSAAREVACADAAALGIASLHEMGHPGLSGLDDALIWAGGSWPIEVLVWWAELETTASPVRVLRPGGDLFLDGSIGSRSAAVTGGYRDGGHGALFHDDAEVAAFFTACTRAGQSAGVHAIGDVAIEQAIAGLEAAAEALGAAAVRRCRHRIEHVELPRADHPSRMARLGVVASVQPAFDAEWGGPDRLYAERFGSERAKVSNPFRSLAAAGVRLAFGSDSTVTPFDPWGGVHAAEHHRGGLSLSRIEALAAHTLGGRFVAGQDDVGPLRPGARADLAVWDADPLAVEDPRTLRCLGTVSAGRHAYGQLPLP
ncbi:MAG: amidohydrolase family protein [Nitriliruptorales bacterium]|nr:amidohydrolase family protein [Nitriliruptorales bacterium]